MSIVLTNFQNTTLAAASASGSTSFTLSSSANLPALTAGQIMPLVLNDAATGAIYEVVYVTAISGAVLTVTRAQEGTTAQNWNIGDFAYCAPTAQTLATINGSSSQVFNAANATAGTQEVVPISQADIRYAPINGSSSQVFNVANATTSTEAVALGQADGRYTPIAFSQVGSITAATTLTAAQSGMTFSVAAASAAYNITLPALFAGMRYRLDGTNGAYAVGLTYTGTLYLPDGTTAAAGTFSQINLAAIGNSIEVWSDGTNVYVDKVGGQPIIKNAVAANQAVALGQSLAGATSSQNIASSRAYGTVYTNSTSRTRLVKMSSTNVSATIQLSGYVNGNLVDTGLLAAGTAGGFVQITLFVPPGATYEVTSVSGGSAINSWQETT